MALHPGKAGKMNAQDVLMYGHRWVHGHLDGLSEQHWQIAGVCGWWSVREIMIHLTAYEWVLVDVFKGFTGGGETALLDQFTRQRGDAFNNPQIEQRKSFTNAQIVAEYDTAYHTGIERLVKIDESTLRLSGSIPWYGNAYSLDDLIVYQYYGHKREHMAQVSVFRDGLK